MVGRILPWKEQELPWLYRCSLRPGIRQPLVDAGLVFGDLVDGKIERRVMGYGNYPRPFLRNLRPASLLWHGRLFQGPGLSVRIMKPMAVLLELIIRTFVLQDLVHLFRSSVYAKSNCLRPIKPPLRCISGLLIKFLFSTCKV